jgi:histidinol-phosphate aminotransferase
MSWLAALARPEILALKPYEPAGWEPSLTRLHANELPWRAATDDSAGGLNRYPQPLSQALQRRLAALYDVSEDSVLAGRGSDEAIDLLVRVFCRAQHDAVLICPPTFGMYAVAAQIQGARIVCAPLNAEQGFALEVDKLLQRCGPQVKIVFVCSPNNPTGNLIPEAALLELTAALHERALLVVDEAYVEFAGSPSMSRHLARWPNLAVLRTLSKAHGLAGARCGCVIAQPEIIALLQKVIPPYAISQLTIEAVLAALAPEQLASRTQGLDAIRTERERLLAALRGLPAVTRVWPSDANFVLAEFQDPERALALARAAQLLVRDARHYPGLSRALRITVGTSTENARLVGAWS